MLGLNIVRFKKINPLKYSGEFLILYNKNLIKVSDIDAKMRIGDSIIGMYNIALIVHLSATKNVLILSMGNV